MPGKKPKGARRAFTNPSSPRGGARRAEGLNTKPRRPEGLSSKITQLLAPHQNTIDKTQFTKAGILRYNPALKERAHENRYAQNLPEVLLWNQLKQDQLDVDFHRQKPIGNYIVDLFCPELMLAIEVDGGYHDRAEIAIKDKKRQAKLESLGVAFMRFTTDQVKNHMLGVVASIEEFVGDNMIKVRLSQIERAIVNKNNLRSEINKILAEELIE